MAAEMDQPAWHRIVCAWCARALGLAFGLVPIALMALLSSGHAQAAAPDAPWRVVLLSGADPTQPASLVLDRSFRRAMQAVAPHGVEFFADNVDSLRFQGGDLTPELRALLAKKYTNQSVDLVVGLTEFASAFIKAHHEALWPGVPVMIYGIDEARLKSGALPAGFTYVPWRTDPAGTIALAEALQPKAQKLVVIAGAAALDGQSADAAMTAARQRALGRWSSVELWQGLSVAELRQRVAALDNRTALLFTTMHRDSAGVPIFPLNALRAMTEVSKAPVYGTYSTYLDGGLIAGSVVDFEANAERAAVRGAEMLLRRAALPSAAASALDPAAAPPPPRCVADARRLAAFRLDVRDLPDSCNLLNPPVSIWRDHRDLVLIAIAFLLLQTLSIAALLWQRRRRRAAKQNVLAHGVELARATRVAALGELSASIAHEIRQPLGAILSNADAAEMLLDAGQIDLPQLREILGDIRRDDLRAHEVIRRLRALLQMKQVEHAPLAMHEACDEALKLISADAARSEVRIERQYAASDDQIVGDRIQLQQVLINLVRNGIEAVDGLSSERRVVIVGTTERAGGVVLRVTDRGPGVREADRARLFDAFFTTKANGMGMGLSIVRSIVDAHQGTLQVESAAGGGSVFSVWWPRSSEPSTLSPAIDTTVSAAPA